MEFDSDEERKIFCISGEDDDDVESEYSSEEEGLGFLSERHISESSQLPGGCASTPGGQLQRHDDSNSGFSYESESCDDKTLVLERDFHDEDAPEEILETTLIEAKGEIEFERDDEGGVFGMEEERGGFGFSEEGGGFVFSEAGGGFGYSEEHRRLFLFSSSTESSNKSDTPLSPDQALIFSPDLIGKASLLFSTATKHSGGKQQEDKNRRTSSSSSGSRITMGDSLESEEAVDIEGTVDGGDDGVLYPCAQLSGKPSGFGTSDAVDLDVVGIGCSRETTPDSMSTSGTPVPEDSSYVFQDARAAVRPRRLPPSQPKRFGGGGGGKKHNRRCSECAACLNEIDCGKCRFCKDMRKFGGPGRLRQKCIKRQCLKLSRILYEHDPLLGGNTQKMQDDVAAELKKLGSLPKHAQVGTEFVEKHPKMVGGTNKEVAHPAAGRAARALKPPKKTIPKKAGGKRSAPHGGGGRGRKRGKRSTRPMADYQSSVSDHDFFPYTSSGRRRRPLSDVFEGMVHEDPPPLVQCWGPGCINAARPHSKYCCEDCGVQLAIK